MSEVNEIVFEGKRFEKLKRALTRRNVAFKKMSRKEQRLQVARDVIELSTVGKIVASGTYLSLPDDSEFEEAVCIEDPDYDGAYLEEARPEVAKIDTALLLEQLPACEVCGIGSLFVATLRRNDKLPLTDFTTGYKHDTRGMQVEYLKKWFDSEQLDLVEAYFENERGHDYPLNCYASPIFNEEDADKRLTMIMENIVSNGGKFDPLKGKHKIKPSED
jgi:hypothetical protein